MIQDRRLEAWWGARSPAPVPFPPVQRRQNCERRTSLCGLTELASATGKFQPGGGRKAGGAARSASIRRRVHAANSVNHAPAMLHRSSGDRGKKVRCVDESTRSERLARNAIAQSANTTRKPLLLSNAPLNGAERVPHSRMILPVEQPGEDLGADRSTVGARYAFPAQPHCELTRMGRGVPLCARQEFCDRDAVFIGNDALAPVDGVRGAHYAASFWGTSE